MFLSKLSFFYLSSGVLALLGSAAIPIFFSYNNYFVFKNQEKEDLERYMEGVLMKKPEANPEYEVDGADNVETIIYLLVNPNTKLR